MNFTKFAAVAALSLVASTGAWAASISNTYTLDLSSGNDYIEPTYKNSSKTDTLSFTDEIDFSLTSAYDAVAIGTNFLSSKTNISGGTFALYTSGGTLVDSTTYSLTDGGTTATYADLTAGSYYFVVTGTIASKTSGTYDLDVTVSPATGGGSAVPEPATTALLLAGVGVMGFLARRRNQK